MKNKNSKNIGGILRLIMWLFVVIIFVAIFSIIPRIFSSHDLLYQTLAVVLSVLFTAIVTNQLLTGQSSNEEAREKNIKVHENKIEVYADFVSKMWATMKDGKVVPEEIEDIRSEIFNKLIFYLEDEQIEAISEALRELSQDSSDQQYIKAFQKITKVLRSNIMETETDSKDGNIMILWNRFNEILPEPKEEVAEVEPEPQDQIAVSEEQSATIEVAENKSIKNRCVHFNILDQDWQYKIFSNGNLALALCEYGESQRTNRIKSCRLNDVVFLYKTGGPGYVGAFLAKGWVVFKADGKGNIVEIETCEFTEIGKNTKSIIQESEWPQTIKKFDAESCLYDGCTLISYLMVEPLVFYEKGIGRISVYRATISTYDSTYAWRTMGRFKAALETEPENINKYTFEGKVMPIQTNERELQKLIADNHIISSEWSDTQGWIDK